MSSFWQWCKRYWWKFAVVGLTLVLAYLFYLDAQLRPHFSGNKWQVPVQVYARPLTLSINQEITPQEVIDELELLGYRRKNKSEKVGEYSLLNSALTVQRRAFHFLDGAVPTSQLDISWRSGRIARLSHTDSVTGEADTVELTRLEPWLVTRLLSGNREDRMLLRQNDLPPYLVDTLVMVEDRNFYSHFGVNPIAIARALFANIVAGRKVQGGSTLTQQLIKNLYLTREQTYTRKIKEALMSIVIDARYDKDEILLAYLNEVFIGQNGGKAVHGFGLGAHFYFDRPLNELNLPEIATLVGMLKGPSYYNPRRYPERALARRDLVLKILFEQGVIDKSNYMSAIESPLNIASGASLASGKHPSFMAKLKRELTTILADPAMRNSGIRVFTTLDINAQRRAENALAERVESVANTRKIDDLQAAMVVSDSASGGIRVIVGDRDVTNDGFNRALDMERSIGSLVKPAIYVAALEQADTYRLATILRDEPIVVTLEDGQVWRPQNADEEYRGAVNMLDSLTQSYNLPAVNLALDMGLDVVVQSLQNLGVDESIPELPAITLGAVNLTPLQVNQMYQTIANDGVLRPLHTVTGILDAQQKLLWRRTDYGEQRIPSDVAYLLNYGLHKVTREGTASALGKIFPNINMAGKTGTTNDYRDSWFAGFDRNLVASIWMGSDSNAQTGLSGSSGALRVYIDWQRTMTPKSLSRRFPSGLEIAHFNPDTGAQRAGGCRDNLSLPAVSSGLNDVVESCTGRIEPKARPKEQPEPKRKSLWERLFGG